MTRLITHTIILIVIVLITLVWDSTRHLRLHHHHLPTRSQRGRYNQPRHSPHDDDRRDSIPVKNHHQSSHSYYDSDNDDDDDKYTLLPSVTNSSAINVNTRPTVVTKGNHGNATATTLTISSAGRYFWQTWAIGCAAHATMYALVAAFLVTSTTANVTTAAVATTIVARYTVLVDSLVFHCCVAWDMCMSMLLLAPRHLSSLTTIAAALPTTSLLLTTAATTTTTALSSSLQERSRLRRQSRHVIINVPLVGKVAIVRGNVLAGTVLVMLYILLSRVLLWWSLLENTTTTTTVSPTTTSSQHHNASLITGSENGISNSIISIMTMASTTIVPTH